MNAALRPLANTASPMSELKAPQGVAIHLPGGEEIECVLTYIGVEDGIFVWEARPSRMPKQGGPKSGRLQMTVAVLPGRTSIRLMPYSNTQ